MALSPIARMIDAAVLTCTCCGAEKDLCACWAVTTAFCPNGRAGCGRCFRCCSCEVEQPDLPTRIRRDPKETPREFLIRRYVATAMRAMRDETGARYPPRGDILHYPFPGGRLVTLWGEAPGSVARAYYEGPEGWWELGWGASAPVGPRLLAGPEEQR